MPQPLALALLDTATRTGFEILMLTPLSVVQYVSPRIVIQPTVDRSEGGSGYTTQEDVSAQAS